MKKTQFIDLLTTIKKTFVSFFSITLFVAMGVAVFLGIGWGGPGLAKSVDKEQDINNLRDLEILTPYGFEESDLNEIRKVEGVKTVEGSYTTYGYFNMGDTKYQAKLVTLPKTINTLFSVTGNLPTRGNEIVMERHWAEAKGLKVGDTVSFIHDASAHPHALSLLLENEDKIEDVQAMIKVFEDDGTKECGMQYLLYDKFTVTALAESPDYISTFAETYGTSATLNTPVDCIAFLPEEAFDTRSFTGYNDILVKSNYLEGVFTDPAFRTANDEFKDRVNEVVQNISSKKNQRIINIATNLNTKLEEAPTKVKEYRQEITRTQREVETYNRLISEGKKRIEQAREMLNSARNELAEVMAMARTRYDELSKYIPTVEDLRDKLASVKGYTAQAVEMLKDLQAHPEKIDQAKTMVSVLIYMGASYLPESMQEMLMEIYANLDDYAEMVKTAVTDTDFEALAAKIPDLNIYLDRALEIKDRLVAQANNLIAKAREKVADFTNRLNEQMKELDAGQEQVNVGAQQITEYEQQVESAELMLEGDVVKQFRVAMSDIKDYSSAILTVYNNPTNVSTMTMAEILSRAKYTLAILFFIVGALVCYSALSRIIYSHMQLIGTKKALGLSKGEITRSYMTYGAVAAIVGSFVGLAIGYFAIQRVVLLGIRKDMIFRENLFHFDIIEFLILFALELVIILGATFLACRRLLKEQPVTLLAGPTPSNGRQRFYERFKLWKKLPLFSKTMFNNVLTDKRRVVGTLIGIVGCTTMMVCGMGLKFNADRSADLQFGQLCKHDTMILFNDKVEGSRDAIQKLIDSKNLDSATFGQYCYRIALPGGRVTICYLYVTDDDNFTKFFTLRNENGNLKDLSDGVRACCGLSENYSIDTGDNLEFVDNTGQHFFIPYVGTFESYTNTIITIVSAESYERYAQDTYRPNAFTLTLGDGDKEALRDELEEIPGFITLYDYQANSLKGFRAIGDSLTILASVAISLAIIMAFLVLLNLLVMHVEEKRKEMIILMINGYSVKDAKKYVYKDTIFLSVIGIGLGSALGMIAANVNLEVYSYLPAHFYRGISWPAIGIGVVLTGVLTYFISKVAMRRIKHFDLTEINKF